MPKNTNLPILAISPEHIKEYIQAISEIAPKKYSEQFSAIEIDNISVVHPWDSQAPNNSIAIHFIQGVISYRCWWNFSTSDFIKDIEAAEKNPAIIGHLLYIDSPGGEVFYLHEAANAIHNLQKPVIALYDRITASAAVWLGSAANKSFATSAYSRIGSIGVMTTIVDNRKALEQYGYKEIEIYSNFSPDKNRLINDVLSGKIEEYQTKVLDPMAIQFKKDMQLFRKTISDEALSGEMYYAAQAQELGLIDGFRSLEEAIIELYVSSTNLPEDIYSII